MSEDACKCLSGQRNDAVNEVFLRVTALLTLVVVGRRLEALGHRIRAASPSGPESFCAFDVERGWVNMELLVGGQWPAAPSGRVEEVTSPFDAVVAGADRPRRTRSPLPPPVSSTSWTVAEPQPWPTRLEPRRASYLTR